jgi:hypothetical protein
MTKSSAGRSCALICSDLECGTYHTFVLFLQTMIDLRDCGTYHNYKIVRRTIVR